MKKINKNVKWQRDCIQSFSDEFMRQQHIFLRYPNLFFQQFYNVLQWNNGEIKDLIEISKENYLLNKKVFLHQYRVPINIESHLLMTYTGHERAINSCSFSPDGKKIVSGSADGALKLWETETSKEITSFMGHNESVNSCSFSLDGRRIVSGSNDKTVKIWDVETGREIVTLIGHAHIVTSCAFSPDGKRVVSGSYDKTLKLWDIESSNEITTLSGHCGSIDTCAFSPDGKEIVSGSSDSTLKIWDADTGREIAALKGHTHYIISCGFSPDGDLIISGSLDKTIKLWDSNTYNEIASLKGHRDKVTSCSFSHDGKRIISSSDDKTIKLWDPYTYCELNTFLGHFGSVTSCAFSHDGFRVISGSSDETLKLWDVNLSKSKTSLRAHLSALTGCAFSPNGMQIISASTDKTINIWDAESGIKINTLKGHTHFVTCCAFSLDGRRIVSGSYDNTLIIWDTATGRQITNLEGHTFYVTYCAFSPDGKRILSRGGGYDKSLKIWDANTGKEIITFSGHNEEVISCSFSPDGKRILSGSRDQVLKIWEADSGRVIRTISGNNIYVGSCIFSPDGKSIVSGSTNGNLKLWDSATGKETVPLIGHSSCIFSCAFSPDGKRIITGSLDNTIKLWDSESGVEISTFIGHQGGVTSCAFSPDGKLIVSGSTDNTIKYWEIKTGSLIASYIIDAKISCSVISKCGTKIAVGDSLGNIHLLKLLGFEIGTPVVTGVRLWLPEGRWSEEITVDCPYCGVRFPSSASQQVKGNNLGFMSRCPECGKNLKFNPFVVDFKQKEYKFTPVILIDSKLSKERLAKTPIQSNDKKTNLTETDQTVTESLEITSRTGRGTTIENRQEVSGTWAIKDSPFRVMGEAIIPKGQTLTIQPGVEVLFHAGENADCQGEGFDKGFLRVNGMLIARGTKESPIRFKGDAGVERGWGTIILHTDDPGCILAHCRIEQSSYVQNAISMTVSGEKKQMGFWGGICLYESTALIENCTFVNNTYAAISCDRSSPVIMGTTIWNEGKQSSNSFVAIRCQDSSYPKVLNCTIVCKKGRGTLSYASIPVIENSIIVVDPSSDQGSGYQHPQIRAWVAHSLLKVKGSDDIYFDAGNNIIEQNPQFDKHANDVFRLKLDSPCIGAGRNGEDIGAIPLGEWVEPSVPEEMEAAFRSQLIAICNVRPIQAEVELLNGDKMKINDVRISDHGAQVDSVMLCEGFDIRAIAKLKDVSCIQHVSEDSVEFILSSGERKPWRSEGRKIIGHDLSASLVKEIALKEVKKIIFSNCGFKNIKKPVAGD